MVGTLFTQHQQGKAQAAMYNQQARVAEANARISDRKQEQIADQALQERDKMSDKMRLIQGQNTAETGASGLMMAGTPLQLMLVAMTNTTRIFRIGKTTRTTVSTMNILME